LIAFTSTRDDYDTYDVYVMAPDGSNQIRLTSDPANDIIPRWWP
jgi:Tol biopolymer transport system component